VQSDDVHGGAAPTKARDRCERHRQPEPGQLGHRVPQAHLAVQLGQGLGQKDQTLAGQPQPSQQRHSLGAQKAGHLTRELRYAFERPNREPLLWLPDLVAGTVSYSRAGLDQQYLEHLQHSMTVVAVDGAT